MSVVQAAAGSAPGAYQTPFRGGVVTVTNIGDLTFMLFRDLTPHTVDVIQGLTAGGLYTSNTIFHRAIARFMNQGGDPEHERHRGPVSVLTMNSIPRRFSAATGTGDGQLRERTRMARNFLSPLRRYRYGDFG